MLSGWRRWIRSLARTFGISNGARKPIRNRSARLAVETLEERAVPTVQLLSPADPVLGSSSAAGMSALSDAASPSISQNGRYVVLESTAPDLVPDQVDTNDTWDVFLRDRVAGTTTLVSHSALSPSITGNNASRNATISADGRYIAYRSTDSDLVDGQLDATNTWDIFLYDRLTGMTTLVSRSADSLSATGAGSAEAPVISADGNYIAFANTATNLVEGQVDSNNVLDVFLYDRAAGTTTLVSRNHNSPTATGDNFASAPSISADGRYVAYTSLANNVLADQDDVNGEADVFLYDRVTQTTALVSHVANQFSSTGLGASQNAVISADGNFVAFISFSGDLVENQIDFNLSEDVFLYNRATGAVTLVSHVPGDPTTAGDGFSNGPALSTDGRYISFRSAAPDLVSGQIDGNFDTDIFLHDRVTGETVLVSHTAGDTVATGSFFSQEASISASGSFVVFTSLAADLVEGGSDVNDSLDVFLWDRMTSSITLVSHDLSSPDQAGDNLSERPEISGDGTVVVFQSSASSLVPEDANSAVDVFDFLVVAAGPTAVITGPLAGTERGNLAFTGAVSDMTGLQAPLTYSWAVYKDGSSTVFASDSGVDLTGFAFTPDDEGSYRVVLDVTDGFGGAAQTEQTVSVVNAAPAASIVSIGTPRVEGTAIAVQGSASDAGTNDELTYSWAVYKDGSATAFHSASGVNLTSFTFTPNDNGSYRIVLTVSDGDGGVAAAEQTISVDNVTPSPSLVSISTPRVEGTDIVVQGAATDPAGALDELTYAWEVYADGAITPFHYGSGIDLTQFTFTPPDEGSYRIVLTVSDGDNGSASVEQTIAVTNVPPTPSIVDIGSPRVEGTAIVVQGTASDSGAMDTLTYNWAVYKDGSAAQFHTASGVNLTSFSFTPDDNGSYRIVLTVSDESGDSSSVEQTVAVANVAPSVTLASIGTPRVEGTAIVVQGGASDAGAQDVLNYTWAVYKDGAATPFASSSGVDLSSFNFTPDDNGSYRIVLTVSDGDDESSVEQTILVANAAPAPSLVSISTPRVEGTAILVQGGATDPAGNADTLTFAWQVFKDGATTPFAQISGVGSTDFSFTPDDDGSYRIVLTVSDEDGDSASVEQTAAVSNVAPQGLAISGPSQGSAGQPMTFTSTATDPGQANDSLSFAWNVTLRGNAVTSGTGASFTFTPSGGGTYLVEVTASDGDGGTASASTAVQVFGGMIVVGAEAGAPPTVRVLDAQTGGELLSFMAYDPSYRGGVRVGMADVNGDGFADVVTGAAINGHVKVFDGRSGAEMHSFLAYAGFGGGVFVAAGDVNGDGFADVITGAEANGHVKVFDGRSGAEMHSFLAYAGFGGAVRVGAGDINGDGFDDIVTGADINAHVKVFEGRTGAELRSFIADPGFNGAVSVAAGDVNGDGFADVIVGAASALTHVKVFDGASGQEHASFVAFPGAVTGVSVGAVDRNADGRDDIVVTPRTIAPHVKVFDGMTREVLDSFFALDPLFQGLNVSAGS